MSEELLLNYRTAIALVSKEKKDILEFKEYFEKRSFIGSQMFKWIEEFEELQEALEKLKGNSDLESSEEIGITKAMEEIADEIITRIQWDKTYKYDVLQGAELKLEFEKLDKIYLILLNRKDMKEIVDKKIKRTKHRIETDYYKNYKL